MNASIVPRVLGVPLLAALLGAAPASLHVRLLRSDPAAGATVHAAPHTISLWFSEPVQLGVTAVRLTGPGGTAVELAPPRSGEGTRGLVICDVRGQPGAGIQQVSWRTMSRDGHAASGTFTFTLAPAAGAAHTNGSVERRR